MTMSRIVISLVVGIVVAAVIFTFVRPISVGQAPPKPLAFPVAVDAGEIPFGTEVPIAVPITNQSDRPIRLTGFRTSCGCMAPNRRTADGGIEPLGDLTLAPGEELTVVIVFRVQVATTSFAYTFDFRTDHPAVPAVTVPLRGRVALGVTSAPNLIAFDPVAPRETATATVELTDLRPAQERGPLDIRPDDPSVAVRSITPGDPARGTYIVALTLSAERAGSVSGKLVVRSATGLPLGEVPFVGQVVSPFQLIPSVVVLPRPGGSDPNSVRVTFRGSSPFRLELTAVPAGLDVRVDGQILIIRRDPTRLGSCSTTIEVKAVLDDGRSYPLSLGVTIQAAEADLTGRP